MFPKVLWSSGHGCKLLLIFFAFSLFAVHRVLKTAHAFAESLHQFGDFLTAKEEQYDEGYDDDFLKANSKHTFIY